MSLPCNAILADKVVQNPFIQNEPTGYHEALAVLLKKGSNFLQFPFHETGQATIDLTCPINFLAFEMSLPAFFGR